MNWISTMLFVHNLSFLLLHEMDAVREKEWKMFIILKSMREGTAYIVFSLVHLPIYIWAILAMSQFRNVSYTFVWLTVDVLLIVHAIIHFFFRKHSGNCFQSIYSMVLIYGMGVLSITHLILTI